jgi:hypothetical protein
LDDEDGDARRLVYARGLRKDKWPVSAHAAVHARIAELLELIDFRRLSGAVRKTQFRPFTPLFQLPRNGRLFIFGNGDCQPRFAG